MPAHTTAATHWPGSAHTRTSDEREPTLWLSVKRAIALWISQDLPVCAVSRTKLGHYSKLQARIPASASPAPDSPEPRTRTLSCSAASACVWSASGSRRFDPFASRGRSCRDGARSGGRGATRPLPSAVRGALAPPSCPRIPAATLAAIRAVMRTSAPAAGCGAGAQRRGSPQGSGQHRPPATAPLLCLGIYISI